MEFEKQHALKVLSFWQQTEFFNTLAFSLLDKRALSEVSINLKKTHAENMVC